MNFKVKYLDYLDGDDFSVLANHVKSLVNYLMRQFHKLYAH